MTGTATTSAARTAYATWQLTDDELYPTVERLKEANQRAQERGLAGRYSWTIDPEHTSRTRSIRLDPEEPPIAYSVDVRTITVTGQVPAFNGWQVGARLHTDTEGVVTHHVEEGFDDLDPLSYDPQQCDHCHTRRLRAKTYLLVHADGEIRQVGSTCLSDFLGLLVGPSLVEASGNLFGDIEDPVYSGGHEDGPHPTPVVLAVAAAAVRRQGWTPRSTDDEYAVPTADLVRVALNGRSPRASREFRPTEADHDTARQARAWVHDHDGGSEYMLNLKAVMGSDHVSPRNLGLAVSAVGTYERARQAERDHEAAKVSQWVGEVKERSTYTLVVLEVRTIERMAYHYYDSGLSWLVILADDRGNRFKWFASTEPDFESGDTVSGKATIKKHTTYREIKETVLTRCRFKAS